MITRKGKALLRSWYGHFNLRFMRDGSVMARRRLGEPWGMLLTPQQAVYGAQVLIDHHHEKGK